MRRSNFFLLIAASTFFCTAAADAARVDMNDPRRALALDDDLRIDAQLNDDAISTGSTVNVTFQVQNDTGKSVAIANRVSDSSYDPESQTVIVSIGSEVPNGLTMPHLVVVKPGEKRTFTAAAPIHVVVPRGRSPFIAHPRYVQVKVIVLRDIEAFSDLIARQRDSAQPSLPESLFETWVQNNDAIFLNAIPVHWKDGHASPGDPGGADVAMPVRQAGGTF